MLQELIAIDVISEASTKGHVLSWLQLMMLSAKVTLVNDKLSIPEILIMEDVPKKDALNREFKILVVSTLKISNTG